MLKKQNKKLSKVKSSPDINDAKSFDKFPIVGIGASAGGLYAFELFFSAIPANSHINMSFILIQHLDPEHKSLLSELVQHYTTMKVYEVKDGMRVEVNCVYIIPPNNDMELIDGTLHLIEYKGARGHHLPIDSFFKSLAKEQKNLAVGIILSGTGHDGTEGIKAIKEAGGMLMAQSRESAQFDGMPSSAIETGLIDYELAPNEMFEKLITYKTDKVKNNSSKDVISEKEEILKKIFILLHTHTGHDFSMYKPSTIGRRIERRMLVNQVESVEKYYEYLKQSMNEVNELFNDLLIGVTSFFRDTDAFLFLERDIIPKLFIDKPSDAVIRVWVAGCSSGEEAYSIAILLMEYMQRIGQSYMIQLFATDIDATAIATARAGIYPLDISANVSQQRLERYFIKNSDGSDYKIHEKIRNMVIFSIHNAIKDPPFSNLDLVSCRNLLIYMNIELQQKLISSFHYALKQNAILFLGTSESLGEYSELFDVIDQKSKLFKCKKNSNNSKKSMLSRLQLSNERYAPLQHVNRFDMQEKIPLKEVTEQAILEQIAPSAALVNELGDILYLHGRTGMYLELPSGETNTNNILKMAREGLQNDLTLALYKAKTTKQIVHVKGLHVKTNGHFSRVNLTIRIVTIGHSIKYEPPLYLVILEDEPYEEQKTLLSKSNLSDKLYKNEFKDNIHVKTLKQELLIQKKFLQDANEKLGESNEELKSYNEEIQSINEELQSTNEELETSKEELQSVNEELSTVNSELHSKVTDLTRSNNDMNNLLAGTGIGTIFVNHKLCILRFTPAVTTIINLIISDLGRPVGHIVSNMLGYNSLVADIQSVLNTLIPKEIEVETIAHKWYLMRIQPYRTLENVIEGAVISFVEITELIRIRKELRKANLLSRLAVVVRDSSDAVTVYDLEGRIIAWNPGAEKLYGWSEPEALRMYVKDRIPKELQDEEINKLKQLSESKILKAYKTKRIDKKGDTLDVSVTSSALIDTNGQVYAIATTERKLESKRLHK